jgi:HEPN domain-containing protein
MFDNPEVVRLVHSWVEKADHDLAMANAGLKLGRNGPTDMTCFHAQQCVEKYVKALFIWRGQPVLRTHNLTALVDRLNSADRPDLSAAEQESMTRYATVTRYPGDYTPITLAEARKAVAAARRARRFIRTRLPKQVL